MGDRLHIHFWWHLHQPMYRVGERSLLPWVKLHACRDYLDMARIVEDHPFAHVTLNVTPVLVEQLEGWDPDPFFDIFHKAADDLDHDEHVFLLRHCFNVNWRTAVYPNPRYLELLKLRGTDPKGAELERQADLWSGRDWDDLQFFFLLAWCGETIRGHEGMQDLLTLARDTSLENRLCLIGLMKEHFERILPYYRKLHGEGLIGLTTTPYFHPILPLLVNPATVVREHPELTVPPISADLPSARDHVERAWACHERVFGSPPDGVWPAEGAVSNDILPLLAKAGIIGTDEAILRASESDMPPFSTPWIMGPTPENSDASAGLVQVEVDRQFSNSTPADASLSKFGEVSRAYPCAPSRSGRTASISTSSTRSGTCGAGPSAARDQEATEPAANSSGRIPSRSVDPVTSTLQGVSEVEPAYCGSSGKS